ncbi:hypothetical protein N7495_008172 [Penicillium taxi]|uniref:uncharacterized protein n=1 Tax=Penicillium taxi TaxID=168475 RepID=UPI0025455C4F|nr:uncharacterized protein N7495_008172 [Penicillium taxi]KAJ5888131.1 hypothetical protein N7495_008172 [Penicillium taxi]
MIIHTLRPLISLLLRNDELFGPRVAMNGARYSPLAKNQTAGVNQIPRILHQTAATDVIPEKWQKSQQSCINTYSDFEYKLWTDESTRTFLLEEYSWFVDIWDSYPYPIQRADSLRYFVLYHFGGMYLDMDTWCNSTFPIEYIEPDTSVHHALFKSTKPTGVTNDFMITSARNPLYKSVITQLPSYNEFSKLWAKWQPYTAIMAASGPMFLTLAVKNYLSEYSTHAQSLPSWGVINATELSPYITDLESSSWHHADAKTFMWVGDRPWTWFLGGAIALMFILYIFNILLVKLVSCFRGASSEGAQVGWFTEYGGLVYVGN